MGGNSLPQCHGYHANDSQERDRWSSVAEQPANTKGGLKNSNTSDTTGGRDES